MLQGWTGPSSDTEQDKQEEKVGLMPAFRMIVHNKQLLMQQLVKTNQQFVLLAMALMVTALTLYGLVLLVKIKAIL